MLSASPAAPSSFARCQLPPCPAPSGQPPARLMSPAPPCPPPGARTGAPSSISNTLLLTDLNDLSLFHSSFLNALRHHISNISRLHSFSPLPSLRRIVLSFATDQDALCIRGIIESGRALEMENQDTSNSEEGFGQYNIFTPRVYFGLPTPLPSDLDEPSRNVHLKPPKSGKQFLISPPPSPPAGWEIREEDPPNAETHAADLLEPVASADKDAELPRKEMPVNTAINPSDLFASLEKVKDQRGWEDSYRREHPELCAGNDSGNGDDDDQGEKHMGRTRTFKPLGMGSTLVYDPASQGTTTDLPLVCVQDTGSLASRD